MEEHDVRYQQRRQFNGRFEPANSSLADQAGPKSFNPGFESGCSSDCK
jgi:hypothetical protein